MQLINMRHDRSARAARTAAVAILLLLAGCSSGGGAATTGAQNGTTEPDDPAVAEVEALSAHVRPLRFAAPNSPECPTAAAVAAAVGATPAGKASGDLQAGCAYPLDGGRSASVRFQTRDVSEVRDDYTAPTAPGQSVSADLDGLTPGAFAVLSGARAAKDADVLVVAADDAPGSWTLEVVGVGEGVGARLLTLADVVAAQS